MPKTFTNDIAPALPSSIEGPFMVADPGDAARWIQLDPAGGGISAAGGARPERALIARLARTAGMTGFAWIGGHLPARNVEAGKDGGMIVTPLRVADDIDVTSPARVSWVLGPAADATINGQTVRMLLEWTRIGPDGAVTEGSVTTEWAVPDDWHTDDYRRVLVDNGSGHTFDAGALAAGDVLGLRIQRTGAHASDTFNQTILYSEHIHLAYTATGF